MAKVQTGVRIAERFLRGFEEQLKSNGVKFVEGTRLVTIYHGEKEKTLLNLDNGAEKNFVNFDNMVNQDGFGLIEVETSDGFSKQAVINAKGKYVIEPQFTILGDFDQGRKLIRFRDLNENKGYISIETGKLYAVNEYVEYGDFYEGRAAVKTKSDGQYGYLNERGEMVILDEFDWADDFSGGKAIVGYEGRAGVIDAAGRWLIEPKYDNVERLDFDCFQAKKEFKTIIFNGFGVIILKLQNCRKIALIGDENLHFIVVEREVGVENVCQSIYSPRGEVIFEMKKEKVENNTEASWDWLRTYWARCENDRRRIENFWTEAEAAPPRDDHQPVDTFEWFYKGVMVQGEKEYGKWFLNIVNTKFEGIGRFCRGGCLRLEREEMVFD